MALPDTDNYQFEEDKTRAVGTATEAVGDHDTLAENTDWLKQAKVTGWRGNSISDGTRTCEKTGTGQIWVANITTREVAGANGYGPVSLHDVSAVPLPDSDGFKDRIITLSGDLVMCEDVAGGGPGADSFMPNGANHGSLAGDAAMPANSCRFHFDGLTLPASGGETGTRAVPPTSFFRTFNWTTDPPMSHTYWRGVQAMPLNGDYDVYFWIDDTTGDPQLMITETVQENGNYSELAYQLKMEWGTEWNA